MKVFVSDQGFDRKNPATLNLFLPPTAGLLRDLNMDQQTTNRSAS